MQHSSKKIYFESVKFWIYCILVIWSTPLIASEEDEFPFLPGDGGNPNNAPAAPIDDWIPFMLILSIGFIFYATYKKKKIKS